MEKLYDFQLKIFKSEDDRISSLEFASGQRRRILKTSLGRLKSVIEDWIDHPSVYVLGIYANGQMIGGSRLHLNSETLEYPLAKSLREKKETLQYINSQMGSAIHAEGCALWVNRKYKLFGLQEVLSRATIALANSLGVNNMLVSCPKHTLSMFVSMGFEHVTYKDKPVTYFYPNPKYESFIVNCDVSSFKNANSYHKSHFVRLSSPNEYVFEGDCEGGIYRVHHDKFPQRINNHVISTDSNSIVLRL